MEKQLLFCVYDSKVEGYLPPFTAMNRAVAIRMFTTAVLQEGSDFNNHADDYSLFEIGHYEPSSGELVSIQPKSVVAAHHIMNKHKNQQEDHESGL